MNVRSISLTLGMKEDNLQDSGREEKGKRLHSSQVREKNDNMCGGGGGVRGFDSEIRKGCGRGELHCLNTCFKVTNKDRAITEQLLDWLTFINNV